MKVFVAFFLCLAVVQAATIIKRLSGRGVSKRETQANNAYAIYDQETGEYKVSIMNPASVAQRQSVGIGIERSRVRNSFFASVF